MNLAAMDGLVSTGNHKVHTLYSVVNQDQDPDLVGSAPYCRIGSL